MLALVHASPDITQYEAPSRRNPLDELETAVKLLEPAVQLSILSPQLM